MVAWVAGRRAPDLGRKKTKEITFWPKNFRPRRAKACGALRAPSPTIYQKTYLFLAPYGSRTAGARSNRLREPGWKRPAVGEPGCRDRLGEPGSWEGRNRLEETDWESLAHGRALRLSHRGQRGALAPGKAESRGES